MNIHKRNHRSIKRFLALLAAAAAIAALLWGREQTIAAQAIDSEPEIRAYEVLPGSEPCYAAARHTLAVASTGGWQLFDNTGQSIAAQARTMTAPVCLSSDAVSIFYSVGDTFLQLAYADGRVNQLELDGAIRFADVNQAGQLAVITDREGYKGSVSVYNKQLKPLFQWDAGTDQPICARLSPKGQVAIACVTDEGYRLLVFSTDRQEPIYQQNVAGERILDLSFVDEERVTVLTDATLLTYSDNGIEHTLQSKTPYPSLFDASAEFAAVVYTPERFGGAGTLCSLLANGKEQYTLPFPEDILDISIQKNRILLLTKNELILCSRRLETLTSLPLRQEAQHIFLRPDNTALAVGFYGVDSYDFGR